MCQAIRPTIQKGATVVAPKKQGTSEEDFLRAAWDLLGDVCLNHSVHIAYAFTPDVQRGVFRLRLRAVRTIPNSLPKKIAEYEMPFPNTTVQSMGAALFRCANQLDHLLGAYERQEQAEKERDGK